MPLARAAGCAYMVRMIHPADAGFDPGFLDPRARLLLRFGDEQEELEYEVPGAFEIRPASAPGRIPSRAWLLSIERHLPSSS